MPQLPMTGEVLVRRPRCGELSLDPRTGGCECSDGDELVPLSTNRNVKR